MAARLATLRTVRGNVATGPNPRKGTDRTSLTDPRAQRQLRRAIGAFGLIVVPVGLVWVVLGLALGDAPLVAVSLVSIGFGAYLLFEYATSESRPAASLATRAGLATNLAIIGAVTAEPVLGISMTMAATIPAVLALAHAARRMVALFMVLGAATSLYAALASSILPWGSDLPSPMRHPAADVLARRRLRDLQHLPVEHEQPADRHGNRAQRRDGPLS